MAASRLFRWCGGWLLLFSGACAAGGCAPPEKVVINYRGGSLIEQGGAVWKDDAPIGVIAEVHASLGVQRVVVQLPEAARLQRMDRYVPIQKEGVVGLRVIPGGGGPLVNGAVVEAGFDRPPAPMAPSYPGVAQGSAVNREDGNSGYSETPDAAPPQVRSWYSGSTATDLQHEGILTERFPKVPRDLLGAIEESVTEARRMPPEEAVYFLAAQRKELLKRIAVRAREAHERKDDEAMRQLRKLENSTERMMLRLRAQARQAG